MMVAMRRLNGAVPGYWSTVMGAVQEKDRCVLRISKNGVVTGELGITFVMESAGGVHDIKLSLEVDGQMAATTSTISVPTYRYETECRKEVMDSALQLLKATIAHNKMLVLNGDSKSSELTKINRKIDALIKFLKS